MKLQLDSGEEGEAIRFEDNQLTLMSPKAFAPGAPIRFSVAGAETPRAFEGRTLGSKRADDGRFEVRLRFVNLRRADRELLLRELA